MAAKARDIEHSESEDQYELVPYKEIQDLKHELSKLKEIPIPTTKKLQVSIDELAMKLDRLTAIFEEAGHEIKTEEGGLTFQEKMKPLFEKMNKVLEQNSEIAKGIVAVADLVNEMKSGSMAPPLPEEPKEEKRKPTFPLPGKPGVITPPPRPPPGAPLPPPPAPKRRTGFF